MYNILTIILTAIIASATVVYAISAIKLYKASKEFMKNRFKEKMVEINIDKAVEFYEITAPILMGLRSVARSYLQERGAKKLQIPYISDKERFSTKDKYGIDRIFWQIHIMYKPSIPMYIWKKYDEFGKAYENFYKNPSDSGAQKIMDLYDEFQNLIREIYNLKEPDKAFNLLIGK